MIARWNGNPGAVTPTAAVQHDPHIFGASATSFGALLITVGALLLIADVIGPTGRDPGLTWGGTAPDVRSRVAAALALSGAILVLAGSVTLLVVAGISALAVVFALVLAAVLVYGAMSFYLWRHFKAWPLPGQRENDPGIAKSFWWCLVNPGWEPPED